MTNKKENMTREEADSLLLTMQITRLRRAVSDLLAVIEELDGEATMPYPLALKLAGEAMAAKIVLRETEA